MQQQQISAQEQQQQQQSALPLPPLPPVTVTSGPVDSATHLAHDLDELTPIRVIQRTRSGQRNRNIGDDASRSVAHHQHPVGQQHRRYSGCVVSVLNLFLRVSTLSTWHFSLFSRGEMNDKIQDISRQFCGASGENVTTSPGIEPQ